MRTLPLLTIFVLLALFGCQSNDSTISRTNIIRATEIPMSTSDGDRLTLNPSDFVISVPYPTAWTSYQTESGIVMAEPNTTTAHNLFNGIIFHIWTHPLHELGLADTTSPQAILEEITDDPIFIGNAVITPPQPFHWDGIEASYYILNNQLGHISLIIGMTLPDYPQLIAISITAPASQAEYLRQQAPLIIDGITIDEIVISGAILDQILPASLTIPTSAP